MTSRPNARVLQCAALRLALGGLRLAAWLNRSLGDAPQAR